MAGNEPNGKLSYNPGIYHPLTKLCNIEFNVKCDGKVQSTFPSILGIFRENSVISLPK
jgi:hypothetical protein